MIKQVQADSVRPIQVFMSTHRPEEIMEEITTVSMAVSDVTQGNHTRRVVTLERPIGMSREKLLSTALETDDTGDDSMERFRLTLAHTHFFLLRLYIFDYYLFSTIIIM